MFRHPLNFNIQISSNWTQGKPCLRLGGKRYVNSYASRAGRSKFWRIRQIEAKSTSVSWKSASEIDHLAQTLTFAHDVHIPRPNRSLIYINCEVQIEDTRANVFLKGLITAWFGPYTENASPLPCGCKCIMFSNGSSHST